MLHIAMDGLFTLEAKWIHLRLLEEEQQLVALEDDLAQEERIKERISLVGKLLADRTIKFDLLKIQWIGYGKLTNLHLSKQLGVAFLSTIVYSQTLGGLYPIEAY